MRKISLALAFVASLLTLPAQAANFSAKDAAAATIIFVNPGNCTTGCTPIFAWSDSTGANLVAVITAGADAASNTATGGIVYNRNMVFNGTTWDRWQGGISIASGKVASGAFASGAISAGAGVDGWDLTEGAIADAAVTAGASGSVSAKLRAISRDVGTVATNSALPLPAQSNFTTNIGNVALMDANSNVALNDPCATGVKVYTPVNVVTATNVIITGVSAKKKYICSILLYPGGTVNFAVYQATTSTSCATAAADIFGGHTTGTGFIATAAAGFVAGNGASSIAATNTVNTDICITTSASVQVSGVVVTVDR